MICDRQIIQEKADCKKEYSERLQAVRETKL